LTPSQEAMLSVAKPAPFAGNYSNLGGIARVEQSEMLEYGQGQQPRFDGSGLMNHENLAQCGDENAGLEPTVGEYDHYLRNMEQFQEYVNQRQAEESPEVKISRNQGPLDPSMLVMASNDDFDFDKSIPSQPKKSNQGPLDPSLLMMASNDDFDFDRSHPGVDGQFGAIRQENVYTFNNAESINNFGDPNNRTQKLLATIITRTTCTKTGWRTKNPLTPTSHRGASNPSNPPKKPGWTATAYASLS
jgi:hypothetical protein